MYGGVIDFMGVISKRLLLMQTTPTDGNVRNVILSGMIVNEKD